MSSFHEREASDRIAAARLAGRLRLVSSSEAPAPVATVETFAFVDGPAGMFAMHNGKTVGVGAAVYAVAEIARRMAERQEAAAARDNVDASTPGGLL